MTKFNKLESTEKTDVQPDDAVDVNRRQSLGRLIKYTAPAMLAMLISTREAAAVAASGII